MCPHVSTQLGSKSSAFEPSLVTAVIGPYRDTIPRSHELPQHFSVFQTHETASGDSDNGSNESSFRPSKYSPLNGAYLPTLSIPNSSTNPCSISDKTPLRNYISNSDNFQHCSDQSPNTVPDSATIRPKPHTERGSVGSEQRAVLATHGAVVLESERYAVDAESVGRA